MLRPRWQKTLRDLWLHKARTMLVALAIAIGIIGAGSVLDTWSLLRRATRSEFSASEPASATLRTSNVDESLLELLRAMPSIRLAEARRTVAASVYTSTGWRSALLMSAPELDRVKIGLIKGEQGEWPPRDDALTIESSSADYAGAAIGDRLMVRLSNGQERELEVSGVARDVGLAPGWMEHIVYIFVTPAALGRIGAGSEMDEVRIVVRDRGLTRERVRRVAEEVRATIEKTGRKVVDIEVPVPGRHIHAAQIDSLLYTQGAFGMLALLLSGFLVINLVSAMLAGQVREIGVMKAVGAGAGQLATMYLVQALAIGVAASLIAIPVALAIGRYYARFTAEMLNFDVSGASVPVPILIAQVGVGIILPIAAAAIPVIKGTRMPVSEALRDFGIGTRSDGGGGLLGNIPGVARPILLSLRNAFRRRSRMILTLLALSTGGAVFLGAINLRSSVVESVGTLFGTQRFDMVIRFAAPHAEDSIMSIVRGVAGVEKAEAWNGTRASVKRIDGSVGNAFPVTAPPAASTMVEPSIIAGRFLREGDRNALVINERLLADEPSAALGSRVTLIIRGRESLWRIVGVSESAPTPVAFAPRESIAPMVSNGRASTLVVKSSAGGGASQFDLMQRLRTTFGDSGFEVASGQLMSEQRKVVEDHLLMVAGFLGVMANLIIIVGGLGLASSMSLGVLERTREIGVMRAIGASHRSILGMIQLEGLVVGLLSWVVAIPLSIPMSVVLARAFGRIMLKVPVHLRPEVSGVLEWLAVVVVVSVVACLWPALRATRIPTARALAYE